MGERWGEIGRKVGEYEWTGKKRKGQDSKNRVAGGVGFLGKDYLCDIIEVIKDTKFDENVWTRVPGERGAKYFILGNICMPPESKSMVKEILHTEEARSGSRRCTASIKGKEKQY